MCSSDLAQLGAQERFQFKEVHMGMEVRIVLYAADSPNARRTARAAFDKIEELENIMSDYRPESELRRLERQPGVWVPVSKELTNVLAYAIDVASKTEGAFDPTVAPLVKLWREARRTKKMPGEVALDAARSVVGWRRVELDIPGSRVRLAPGTQLDLGGIAKGFILQQALRADERILIEAGGDMALGLPPPGKLGWTIEVSDTSLVLAETSVATSGSQSQFVVIEGFRYSHVIDPRRGVPLTNNYQATVIAKAGALSDALATALTVVGPERARTVLARFPGATGFVR